MTARPSAIAMLALATIAADEPPARPIDPARMLEHIKILASDDFEGRAPGTPGEEKTVAYLIEKFRALGLSAGNPDGTFVQEVPLVGSRTTAEGAIAVGGRTIELESTADWVGVSPRQEPKAAVEGSEVVFVGYAAVAPEFDWDDVKGADLKGKTLVMLVGDPPVPDPADPSKLDPAVFGGRAMTYYGRWTYKYEFAEKVGAAAALIVHEEGPAGYPFEVVVGSRTLENFDLPADDRAAGRPAIEGWLTLATARRLFEAAGLDFDAQKAAAARRDFRPVPIGDATARFTAENALRSIRSRNVMARLEGSDPARRDQHVVYTAHWDHLGRDPKLDGDQIYNGAADNASGVAALLELAGALSRSEPRPARSALFLAVTAEEKGLLGSQYYAENPLWPLATTAANINMDVLNLWGPTEDVVSVGRGLSTLDDLYADLAAARGRRVGPDPEPEKGMYYRSDHFSFARAGVPALNAKGGTAYRGRPADYGLQKRQDYTRNDYHKVTDEVKPDWDLDGAAEDITLLLDLGRRVADADAMPEWKPGSEFRAVREASLRPRP